MPDAFNQIPKLLILDIDHAPIGHHAQSAPQVAS